MKIYLAGPMRGIPEFNFPAFHQAAAELRKEGHFVFSPAEKDNEKHGTDISKGNLTGDESIASQQHGFNLREALAMDLNFICLEANAIVLLSGWDNSKGAKAEKATAEALGLDILYYLYDSKNNFYFLAKKMEGSAGYKFIPLNKEENIEKA